MAKIEGQYTDRTGLPLEWEDILNDHPKETVQQMLERDSLIETITISFKNGAKCTYRRKAPK